MAEVSEIPSRLRRKLTFIPVETMREVLDICLEHPLNWRNDVETEPIVTHSHGPIASVREP